MEPLLCDSLTEGDFGNGLPLCASWLEGDFWSRNQGGYNVYRGEGHIDNIDFGRIVATCTSKGLLSLPDHIGHQAGRDYFYAVRCVSGTGKQEKGTMAVVRLSLDDQGDRCPKRPNCVRDLTAGPAAGGKIRVCWWYWPLGQEARPSHFAVFGDGGTGVIDYESSLAEIDYRGAGFYSYLSSPGDDRQQYRFGVRAVASLAGCGDCGNRTFVEAVVDLSGPDGIEGLAGNVKL
jgi:hypothetical protein